MLNVFQLRAKNLNENAPKEDANLTAVLEFGLDENYVMILYENNPIKNRR